MPGWVPFTALTLVVLFVLLGLARLSQGAVSDSDTDESTPDSSRAADSPGDRPPVGISGEMDVTPATRPVDGERHPTPAEHPETDPLQNPEITTGALLANVAFTQGLFGALIAAGAWYYEIPSQALGLSGGSVSTVGEALGVGFVFGVVLWTANEMSATIADAVGATYDEDLRGMLAPDSVGGWAVLLAVILPIIAVVEELLFRAALVGVPAAGFGISPWALAILSSVAFALGHGAQGRVGIAVTGGLGFVLASGYVLSGSLVVVVVAHYLVNALEFLVHEGLGVDRMLS